MMVNGHSKSMKLTCIKQHMLPFSMYGLEKLEKKPKGIIKSLPAAWQNGRHKSKVEASKTIHQFLMAHLSRELHPCELFQMFTMLFVRMILLRLQRRSRSFQRKPLQQQAEGDQQLSIQEMNLQGLIEFFRKNLVIAVAALVITGSMTVYVIHKDKKSLLDSEIDQVNIRISSMLKNIKKSKGLEEDIESIESKIETLNTASKYKQGVMLCCSED